MTIIDNSFKHLGLWMCHSCEGKRERKSEREEEGEKIER